MKIPTSVITTSLLLVATGAIFVAGPASAAEAVVVDADGSVTSVTLESSGTYIITVSGTYQYALGGVSPADADFSFGPDGDCIDRPNNVLDLLVNGDSPWDAPCDRTGHTYSTTYDCAAAPCMLHFKIHDDNYGDNSGTLAVFIAGEEPNAYNVGAPAQFSPEIDPTPVSTPGVPSICTPNNLLCVGPVVPVDLATIPGISSTPITPASGVSVSSTDPIDSTIEPTWGTTGPHEVLGPPVPVTLCARALAPCRVA